MSRERANLAEVMASEMLARLEIMAKDVHILAKKVCGKCVVCGEYVWQVCVCMCVCVCVVLILQSGATPSCVCVAERSIVCVCIQRADLVGVFVLLRGSCDRGPSLTKYGCCVSFTPSARRFALKLRISF